MPSAVRVYHKKRGGGDVGKKPNWRSANIEYVSGKR